MPLVFITSTEGRTQPSFTRCGGLDRAMTYHQSWRVPPVYYASEVFVVEVLGDRRPGGRGDLQFVRRMEGCIAPGIPEGDDRERNSKVSEHASFRANVMMSRVATATA